MSNAYDFEVPRDMNHWTNGGTFVTNFQETMRPAYVEAVRRYADANLRVADKADGAWPGYGGALHYVDPKKRDPERGLSDFWAVFEKVRKEMGLKYVGE